jgi:hypothetical protein
MNTQPSPSARRITWYVEHVAWRVEYVAGRGRCPATRRTAKRGNVSAATPTAKPQSRPPMGRTATRTGSSRRAMRPRISRLGRGAGPHAVPPLLDAGRAVTEA